MVPGYVSMTKTTIGRTGTQATLQHIPYTLLSLNTPFKPSLQKTASMLASPLVKKQSMIKLVVLCRGIPHHTDDERTTARPRVSIALHSIRIWLGQLRSPSCVGVSKSKRFRLFLSEWSWDQHRAIKESLIASPEHFSRGKKKTN